MRGKKEISFEANVIYHWLLQLLTCAAKHWPAFCLSGNLVSQMTTEVWSMR